MELIEKIEIVDYGFPIYHSEYLNWVIGLAKVGEQKRKEIDTIYRRILGLIANPEDVLVDNIRIFINGKRFSLDLLEYLDLKKASKIIDDYPKIIVRKSLSGYGKFKEEIISQENSVDENKSYLVKEMSLICYLKKLASQKNPQFFYHTVPITESELFVGDNDYKKINEVLIPYLRFLDLSNVPFRNVDLRGVDLSLTNVTDIDFTTIYKNSLENTNLEGVILIGKELKNIVADGANLQGTYLTIDLDTTSISGCLLDGTNIILKNGLVISNSRARKLSSSILHF